MTKGRRRRPFRMKKDATNPLRQYVAFTAEAPPSSSATFIGSTVLPAELGENE